MKLFDATVPVFTKHLTHVHKWLDKAAAHADARKFDADILLQARLAPDQWALARQLQAACDAAKVGTSILAGKTPPTHPDTEKTMAEIRQRLTTVVDYLATFSPEDFAGGDDRPCTHPSMGGKTLGAFDFLNHLTLPNFHFHLTTAYAILRHNGVELGKLDYLVSLPFQS
ncbi:MAG TPA: DUF1993 domain-containing protein [Kofleriaceae bacterium]|nr:DUF1993 domain-containing protein [Kofleriaceae bacterium]